MPAGISIVARQQTSRWVVSRINRSKSKADSIVREIDRATSEWHEPGKPRP